MDFGMTLRANRMLKKMTQRELGDAVGVTSVTVGNWERGVRLPSFELLAKLADVLGTSADVLLGRENYIEDNGWSQAAGLLEKYCALDHHGQKLVETVCGLEYERLHPQVNTAIYELPKRGRYIPYYDSPSAAGFSAPLGSNDFEMICAKDAPEDADYAVRIAGDSMEPYIHDGDTVFVRKTEELDIGDVGIFCVDGAMYCKRYAVDDDGNLRLLSANPARADANVFVPRESSSTVRCCGKVLGVKKYEH